MLTKRIDIVSWAVALFIILFLAFTTGYGVRMISWIVDGLLSF